MATYTSKQSVLDEALGEFKDYGFRLEEFNDDEFILYFKDKQIARYYQTKATFDIIKQGCENYLKSIAGWQ